MRRASTGSRLYRERELPLSLWGERGGGSGGRDKGAQRATPEPNVNEYVEIDAAAIQGRIAMRPYGWRYPYHDIQPTRLVSAPALAPNEQVSSSAQHQG